VDYGHTYHALRAYRQAPKNKKPPRRKKLTDGRHTQNTRDTKGETWELCTLAQACTGDEGPSFCEPWCPSTSTSTSIHNPSIPIHYFMAELSLQSGHGSLHWYGTG
jgi:hypothetical protein